MKLITGLHLTLKLKSFETVLRNPSSRSVTYVQMELRLLRRIREHLKCRGFVSLLAVTRNIVREEHI